LSDVETYIHAGNARFGSRVRSTKRMTALLEETFLADRGFAVPTVVLTPAELRAVYDDDAMDLEQPIEEECRRYVTLLQSVPDPAAAAAVDALVRRGGGPCRRPRGASG